MSSIQVNNGIFPLNDNKFSSDSFLVDISKNSLWNKCLTKGLKQAMLTLPCFHDTKQFNQISIKQFENENYLFKLKFDCSFYL